MHLLLARGASVDARTDDGSTSLIVASEAGHLDVVRELLARGADANARSNDGFTALHQAGWKGHAEVVRELLSRGAAVNAQADNGATPLILACEEGRLAAATVLLDASADLALLSNAGWSALRCAEQCVALDAAPPAEGAAPPTAAQSCEHKALVALLKARGAA